MRENDLIARAQRPLASVPHSFVKWAGSKRLLLHHIVEHLPSTFGTYYEPFLGGGSLFFLLRPERAVLGDKCGELIEAYAAVRDNVSAVLRYLAQLKPGERNFYNLRSNRSHGRFKRAAEFIYLNKMCWNGLYRVSSKGNFNVPYGRPKTDVFYKSENLKACANALARPKVALNACDFEDTVSTATRGDLVFVDPPYVTGHRNNGFIDYNETLFSWADQERLAELAITLRNRGCHVIVTNAYHGAVLELYTGFQVTRFDRRSTIASSASKRGRTIEVLLRSR